MKTLPRPWSAALEATMFSGWIYDHLKPHAAALKVAHPLMLRAIAAAKKKNDRIDANKICDCLRCDFLPECYMAPTAIRERRRTLRYRSLLVRQMVQTKVKISTLLMEAGVSYNKSKLHKAGYFRELLANNPDINESVRSLLGQCREMVVRLGKMESALIHSLQKIDCSIKKAISYCGLCGDEQRRVVERVILTEGVDYKVKTRVSGGGVERGLIEMLERDAVSTLGGASEQWDQAHENAKKEQRDE